jgi:signal transduction histidine kinase
MSIPENLQSERIKLQREKRGTWRWWFQRGLATLFVVVIGWINREMPGSWPGLLGLWSAGMVGWWLAGLVLEKERWRIERKAPSTFRWVWAGAGTMGFLLAFNIGGSGPQAFTQRTAILTYLLVFGVCIMVLEQADEARRTSFDLLEAREQALRAKLAPHFIFNTLNTLHAQIEQDPRGAQATTERLAQLFRQVISASDHLTIPLRQELAFVEAYLGIEQARLGGRLRVVIEIPEELESAEVPPLSLQVLVENAVKHGVAPREQGGEVRIGVEKRADFLHLWVEDPGSGISSEKGTGTALETLRQRLECPSDLEMGLVEGLHRVSFRWREGSGS